MWFWKRKPKAKVHPLDQLSEIKRELHEFPTSRRAIACYRARALGAVAAPLIPDLIRRAVDLDAVVREAALEALVAMKGAATPRLCDELVEDDQHRNMAKEVLHRIGEPALNDLRDLLLHRMPEYAHHARATSMELIRAQKVDSAHICAQLLRTNFTEIVRESSSHLAGLGEQAVPALEFELAHGAVSLEHAERIALVLATMGAPGLPTLAKMLGSKTSFTLRMAAVKGINDYLSDPEETIPQKLVPRLQRNMPRLLWNLESGSIEEKSATLRLIARLAPYATPEFRVQATSAVVFMAMNEADDRVRRALDIAASAFDAAA